MAIAVQCASCNSSFRVKDAQAGKRGKCPRCGSVIHVPGGGLQANSPGGMSAGVHSPNKTIAGMDGRGFYGGANSLVYQGSGDPGSSGAESATSQAGNAPADTANAAPGKRTPQDAAVCIVGTLAGSPAKLPPGPVVVGARPRNAPLTPHGHDPWASAGTPQRQREILAGLATKIERDRPTLAYRLALVLVSVVMVLLPVLYLGIVALVGWGVFYYATNFSPVLGNSRASVLTVLLYVIPLVIGGMMLIFLLKPLFARPVTIERRRSLTRDGEPLLFEFVDRLCQAVGATPPVRIDVDLDVNASARFRDGFRGMFNGDLVLTIGLPLVAGLSLRQFAGVLAHEFGHFAQGAGMRATYLIMSINMWFARLVYERDIFDLMLARGASSGNFFLAIPAQLLRCGVWCGRRVLQLVMFLGLAVGGALLRQMEYDADLNEIRLAGSRTFEITCRRLPLIGISMHAAFHDLEGYFNDGKLADNLPALIILNLPMVPPEIRRHIDEQTARETTSLFGSHPCPRERIAFAKRQNSEGVFHVEGPASELFRDFRSLSRNCTWDAYRGIFGARLKLSDLCPVDELIASGPPGSANFNNAPIPLARDGSIPLAD